MNKKLVVSAISMILAGGMSLAQADVTVTGNVNVSINSVDNGTTDDVNMSSNTSSVAVKGSEDLGNGLSAMFFVDFQFEADEQSTTGTVDRDQWVGLKGGFGSVKFGTISSSYKSHGAMVDPVYRTSLQQRGVLSQQSDLHNGAGENGEGRMTNHIRWDSANYNGFKATVDYSFDSTEGDADNDDDTYGFGAQYSNGPALVFFDYITNAQGGEDSAWKLGGKYAITDVFTVYGQYENDGGMISEAAGFGAPTAAALTDTANNIDGANLWNLSATYAMGNTVLYGAYAQGDDADGTAFDEGYNSIAIGVDHMLSKRTDAYAGIGRISPDAAGSNDTDVMSVGLRHKF